MGIKDVFNQAPSLEEEALYKKVLDEIKSTGYRDGIYAKAIADSMGDGGKANSLYIKYRVQSLIDEERLNEKKLKSHLASIEKNQRSDELTQDRETSKLSPFLQAMLLVFVPLFFVTILALSFQG
jgi:hypothetical protein